MAVDLVLGVTLTLVLSQITALKAYNAWSLAAAAGQHAGWVFSQVPVQ